MTNTAPGMALKPARPRSPHFPPHNAPRVWFITRGVSPIAIALAKQVLEHGDYVVAGVIPNEFEKSEGQIEDFKAFLEEVKSTERWRERLRVVGLDARIVGQCQAAVAEAVEAFGRIDVLLCAASEGTSYRPGSSIELRPDTLQLSSEPLKNWHRAVEPLAS